MKRAARTGAAGGQRRGVFEVDEDRALAELELAWADGGYHGFSVDDGLWSAISSAGDDQVPRLERFRAEHPEVIILLRGAVPRRACWAPARHAEWA